MTENYIIFIEQPLKLNLLQIITSKLRGKAIYDGISWEPQHNTYFHVVNKHTGEVRGSLAPAAANLKLQCQISIFFSNFLGTFILRSSHGEFKSQSRSYCNKYCKVYCSVDLHYNVYL